MNNVDIAPFRPHPFVWGGHSQTLLAALAANPLRDALRSTERRVDLPDGDQLVLLDDAADGWQPGDPVALLVHGMCGSAQSSYMQRISEKLMVRGYRAFRLNLRGCGAGAGLSRRPYHAGQSDDLQVTAELIQRLAPGSRLVAAGFSLGGNILLKWLGERSDVMPHQLARAIAVNPPANLEACTDHVRQVIRGWYDRHFARQLFRQARGTPHWHDGSPLSQSPRPPRRILDFDELFTAPLAGYASALEYYRDCSAEQVVPQINVPTLILSAKDDPLIPAQTLERMERPSTVKLHIAEGGGHLGYIGRQGDDPDRHWMDWRVIDWLTVDEALSAVA